MVARRPLALLLAPLVLVVAGGCLPPPAESTLAGVLDVTDTYLEGDASDVELEFVCETPDARLMVPLDPPAAGTPHLVPFEMELTADEATYCYFTETSGAQDYFVGFLGLDAGSCDQGTGEERLWMVWDGDNHYAGKVGGGDLRFCPARSLAKPEPPDPQPIDPCVYCGIVIPEYSVHPDIEVEAFDPWPVCVGIDQVDGNAILEINRYHFLGDQFGQLAETLGPVQAKWEGVGDGFGVSAISTELGLDQGTTAAGMFHVDRDSGVMDEVTGIVAVRSDDPSYNWAVRTASPLMRIESCSMPDSLSQ